MKKTASPVAHGDTHCIVWTQAGKGQLHLNGQLYPFQPLRVFLLHPTDHWAISNLRKYKQLTFEGAVLQRLQQSYPEDGYLSIFQPGAEPAFLDLETGEMEVLNALSQLIRSLQPTGRSPRFLQQLILGLLLHLADAYRRKNPPASHETTVIKNLRALIEDHYKTERRTGWYAAQLGFSARRLNARAKIVTGKIVIELLNERLLLEAEKLLRQPQLRIKEVAFALEFTSPNYFATFFKKYTGIDPTAFRLQHIEEDRTGS